MPLAEIRIEKNGHSDADILAVAALHAFSIPTGFLSSSPRLLEILYRCICEHPTSFLLIAASDGEVVGFVAGTTDSGKLYRDFIRTRFWSAAAAVLPRLFSIATVKKVLETLLYPGRITQREQVKAELLSMAVKASFRGRGVAQSLFQGLVAEQRRCGISSFRIVAGSELASANRFYQKMGAQLVGRVIVHGRAPSQLYRFDIRD